ncbi:DUF6702 family protein [Crateriforma conspicua]|uniref:Uncharacterized protein n=2 Tax=Crateriforma conspicua TaxID=2527996 RepID=A0A5C5XY51_9PLAN|nr:DUF6702 family protein [Crateriforma conspicua]QDV63338.1 hypothetical protein Mal65_24800 [Crateriforma conspicua]TWT67890.1 hypothetical protein Pan14r_01280 [Crateriforma conspicua]
MLMPAYALLGLLFLHPVHATEAEVEFNAKSGRLEVALRLDVLDAELIDKVASRISVPDAKPDPTAERDTDDEAVSLQTRRRLVYLARNFGVGAKPPRDAAGRYHWVGEEPDGAYVWWYFEIDVAGVASRPDDEGGQPSAAPNRLRCTLLRDHDSRYVHRVRLLGTSPPVTLQFDARNTVRTASW